MTHTLELILGLAGLLWVTVILVKQARATRELDS